MEFNVINLDASIMSVSLYQRYGFKKVDKLSNEYVVSMKLERSYYGE